VRDLPQEDDVQAQEEDQDTRVQEATNMNENMALLCSILACDRAGKQQTLELPFPGSPECNKLFLATWEAFRHVTTELGKQRLTGLRRNPLEAFALGREIPAHVRWAETEAMIRAGEWKTKHIDTKPSQNGTAEMRLPTLPLRRASTEAMIRAGECS
jgi:hypothetical protein